ncbi:MAG: hypothetical protein P4L74_05870 [Candidatus Doudnabacteria bacterium]|nr:hypothetical protein [Candidatus Doudnabacteria bacterium]
MTYAQWAVTIEDFAKKHFLCYSECRIFKFLGFSFMEELKPETQIQGIIQQVPITKLAGHPIRKRFLILILALVVLIVLGIFVWVVRTNQRKSSIHIVTNALQDPFMSDLVYGPQMAPPQYNVTILSSGVKQVIWNYTSPVNFQKLYDLEVASLKGQKGWQVTPLNVNSDQEKSFEAKNNNYDALVTIKSVSGQYTVVEITVKITPLQ